MTDVDEWASQRPIEDQVAELRASLAALAEVVEGREEKKEKKPPRFTDLPAFVDWVAGIYRVDAFDSHERLWCPEWWKHDTAAVVFDALWHAFEALRQDPTTGVSVWLRDHVYPHMGFLTAPGGPFTGCSHKEHAVFALRRLPVTPPPEGWWTPADSGL